MNKIILNENAIEKINADYEIVLLNKKSDIDKSLEKVLEDLNFFNEEFFIFTSINEKKIYINVKKTTQEKIKIAFCKIINKIRNYKIDTLKFDIFQLNKEIKIEDITEGLALGSYSFSKYNNKNKIKRKDLIIGVNKSSKTISQLNKKLQDSLFLCQCVNYVRDIVNTPPQDYYPDIMAEDAIKISVNKNLKCQVFSEDYLLKNNMNAMYSVSKASINKAKLIHISYIPKKAKKKVVLVGKGVTYDTGGLSLKRGDSMVSMKCDKAGGSAILGIMRYLSEQNLDIEVHGIIGAVENMIGANAYKPDDILKTASGKTVEVTNTDAEGRLVLADCLTYAQNNIKDIDFLFDFATLTGASISAFGGYTTAIMGYNEKIKNKIRKASIASGELVGFLPFNDYLLDKLSSNIADFVNTSANKNGAAITASLFLSKFVKKENRKKWLHFDIAGPSYRQEQWAYNPYGATGCSVRLISKFLKSLNKGK